MSGTKGHSGRKAKSQTRAHAELTLGESAPAAARYLADVVDGKAQAHALKLETARFIVEQICGRAKQKVELTGEEGGPIEHAQVVDITRLMTQAELIDAIGILGDAGALESCSITAPFMQQLKGEVKPAAIAAPLVEVAEPVQEQPIKVETPDNVANATLKPASKPSAAWKWAMETGDDGME